MHIHRSVALVLCGLSWTLVLGSASGLDGDTTPRSDAAKDSAYTSTTGQDLTGGAARDRDGVSNDTDVVVFTPPGRIDVQEEQDVVVRVSFTTPGNRTVSVTSADTGVATVDVSQVYLQAGVNGTGFNLTVRGVFVSYTKIFFKTCLLEDDAETNCTENSYLVAVLRNPTVLQQSFPYLIAIIVSINYVSMGCQIDLKLIVDTLKKPLPPFLGCACQFLFMPLVSYGMGLLLLENALMRFGIFMLGCSPGGNSSNLWTLIFNGDVALSVTMTFVSTIASIGMMPLWVFILGRHMSPETGALRIPFSNIIASLAGLAVPLAIGMAVHRFKPKWALALTKYIKPITIIVLIAILVLSVTVNKYIFLLMTWQALLCGALVSWSAYAFGALAAFVGRLSRAQIIAVAIEIAFQNSGIAVVILYTSLPLPDADLVIVPVVCQAILQGVPLYVLYTAKRIQSCVSKRLHPDEKRIPESTSSEPEVESGLFPAKAADGDARASAMPNKDALQELQDVATDFEEKKSRL
ncbi:ileal sodium/bile acid cotransporter-like [Dermacentor variabilis]|uniref:ileal sodium/bile acid cotransporter-like n=1 Tax=Dermacentor variabilis TaxID=34621 RepID=UPI003F5BEEE8